MTTGSNRSEEREFLHDISSPLTSLQLDLENVVVMLEEGPKPEDIKDCLHLLGNSLSQAKRAIKLIRERRERVVGSGG